MNYVVCTAGEPGMKIAPWKYHPHAERIVLLEGPLGDPVPPKRVLVMRCPHCGKEERVDE
jgi:hypothetical protein